VSDDLIERLERYADAETSSMRAGVLRQAAAGIRTLRAERDAAVQAEVVAIVAWLAPADPEYADLIERGEYKEPTP